MKKTTFTKEEQGTMFDLLERRINKVEKSLSFEVQETGIGGKEYSDNYPEMAQKIQNLYILMNKIDAMETKEEF